MAKTKAASMAKIVFSTGIALELSNGHTLWTQKQEICAVVAKAGAGTSVYLNSGATFDTGYDAGELAALLWG